MLESQQTPNERRAFIHGRFAGAIGGFLTGGPVGALGGFVRSPTRSRGGLPSPPSVTGRHGTTLRGIPVVRTPGIRGMLQRGIPGGATGFQVPVATGSGCPSGFHPNKSAYMTQAGWVDEGSKCVKNRRRNLSNGRANTRSLRRMAAWDKQERRLSKTLKAIARGR